MQFDQQSENRDVHTDANSNAAWFGDDMITNTVRNLYPYGCRVANEVKKGVEYATFWTVDEIKGAVKGVSNDYREFERRRAAKSDEHLPPFTLNAK